MYKIYMLLKDDKPIYIGMTSIKYLCNRAAKHRYCGKDFDTYELIELTEDSTREAYWVSYYDTYNNGLNKSIDGIGLIGGLTSGSIPKKPVMVFNDEGFKKEYESVAEAARQLDLNKSHLGSVCRGKLKQHKGFKAKYIE